MTVNRFILFCTICLVNMIAVGCIVPTGDSAVSSSGDGEEGQSLTASETVAGESIVACVARCQYDYGLCLAIESQRESPAAGPAASGELDAERARCDLSYAFCRAHCAHSRSLHAPLLTRTGTLVEVSSCARHQDCSLPFY